MDDIVKRIRQQSYFGPEPYEAADEIEQLRQRVQELTAERDELRDDKKAGFDRVFEEMHDDPEDPYDRKWSTICLHISSQREEIAKLTAERDELLLYKNLVDEYGLSVFEDMAALKQQRDELLKVLEPFVKHNSSKSVIDLAIRTSDITKARAAIASVKEKA